MTIKKDDNIRKELGLKLKKAREKVGLTQAELASKAGINVSYYAKIERGEVNTSVDKLHKIAKILRIKSLDLS
jgi:transcriptional regulator with XRE-family HTH domain